MLDVHENRRKKVLSALGGIKHTGTNVYVHYNICCYAEATSIDLRRKHNALVHPVQSCKLWE